MRILCNAYRSSDLVTNTLILRHIQAYTHAHICAYVHAYAYEWVGIISERKFKYKICSVDCDYIGN